MTSDQSRPAGGGLPAYLVALAVAAAVLALPMLAGLVDDSADQFVGGRLPAVATIGWVLSAALAAIVLTRLAQREAAIDEGSVLALAYDALPMLLTISWPVTVLAALTGHVLLATVAGALCVYQVVLLAPGLFKARTPRWTRHAPRVELVVANVFVDNETPADAARQLVGSGADVIVIVESTSGFMQVFDGCGGDTAYPHRVADPDGSSDYAVAVVANRELGPKTEFRAVGPLRLAIAELDVEGTSLLVVALNPMATVDPGGHETWKEQIDVLTELLPTLPAPLVLAGDLNATRYRPEFEAITALGFTDAVDALGKGLDASFKLQAEGALGAVGAVVRLDHALLSTGLHAMAMRDLEARGSDHLPFALDLAVRSPTDTATGRHSARRGASPQRAGG